MADERTNGSQPPLEWLMADNERWRVYLAGREAGYAEGAGDGHAEGYGHGLAVGTKASDGYESGAVAGFEAGYQHRATDEAIERGPHVMVFRPVEAERADRLPPAKSPEEIRQQAAESWGLEYKPAGDVDDWDHLDEAG